MNQNNFSIIQQDMQWVESLLNDAFALNHPQHGFKSILEMPILDMPSLQSNEESTSVYAQFIIKNQLSYEDRLLLALAFFAHYEPNTLGKFRRLCTRKDHIAASLIKSTAFDFLLPSGLTYVYLYARRDKAKQYQITHYLYTQSLLVANGVVSIDPHLTGEPALSGILALHPTYWQLLTENIIKPSTDLFILKPTKAHA